MDKRYNPQAAEQKLAQRWEEQQIYKFDKKSNKPLFSIDTPPPTVSGALHIGHVFSYLHTDVLARYKRLAGHNVYYPMGFDDNGLPTEKLVEKKRKVRSKTMVRSEFVKLCLEEAQEVAKEFKSLWEKIGLSVDWNCLYSTISDDSRRVSQLSFLNLYKKHLVYRKQDPALFCTAFRTTVAQAELESVEKSTTFNTIEFGLKGSDEKLLIATTRPELLPACVAVFYHPDDKRYQSLKGKKAITPIFGKQVTIMPDEDVDPDKGTGLVMCCTFGDQADVTWFKKHNLPFIQAIGFDGKMTSKAGELEGLKVEEARAKVLEMLNTSGKLKEQKEIVHNVSIYERSKKEIEYVILPQWFIKILENKQQFLDAAEKIEWFPKFMHSRYKDWVTNLNWDWCISRQRFYGVPFPVWHCDDCDEVLLADAKDLPVDPQEQKYPGGNCSKCGGSNISPDTDVMDTWATSAVTPQINADLLGMDPAKFMPMSVRPQAHDIIRTWAFDTIVMSVYHQQQIPWKKILISGHVLTGKQKISKSANNAKVSPEYLVQNFSADAIRHWSAKGKLGVDTVFSEDQLKVGQRLCTKLWNAFKFLQPQLEGYTKPAQTPELDELSKWLMHKFSQAQANYHKYFEQEDHSGALEVIEKFFWQDFCDNYLEVVKDQIFNPDKYSAATTQSYKFCMYEVGLSMLQLYAPAIPFITEEIYHQLFSQHEKTSSLHITKFNPEFWKDMQFTVEHDQVEVLLQAVSAVRKLKSEHSLSLRTELRNLQVVCKQPKQVQALENLKILLAGASKAQNVELIVSQSQDDKLEQIGEAWSGQVQI